MVAVIETAAGDAVGGGCGAVQDGPFDEGRRVGRHQPQLNRFRSRSAPLAADKLWKAAGPASPPPLTS